MRRRTALVTGASRGIGRACAVALAVAGYDVAATARSAQEGTASERSTHVGQSRIEPLAGSLDSTTRAVRDSGREALALPADLLNPAELQSAVARVLEEWGGVDVLVNSGRYVGPGHMDRILATPLEVLDEHLAANVLAPIRLAQAVLPGMIERNHGRIVNITSTSAFADPSSPAGEGGWGLGYAISKGALHRVAGVINAEHKSQGVLAFNVNPGSVATETQVADLRDRGIAHRGAPADVVGAAVAWLVDSPDAATLAESTVEAQYLCLQLGLLATWAGPPPRSAVHLDTSAANLAALDRESDTARAVPAAAATAGGQACASD